MTDLGHRLCSEAVLAPPSRLSPVSGLNQLGTQTQPLQGLVPDHNEQRRGRGGNDAGRQSLGHRPDALLCQQLLECPYD